MKRSRDQIDKERTQAWAAYCALEAEFRAHPDVRSERLGRRRAMLTAQLPSRVSSTIITAFDITALDIEQCLCFRGGKPGHQWTCRITVGDDDDEDEEQRLFVAWTPCADALWDTDDFEFIDFDSDDVSLFREAMLTNDNDAPRALASFCFACCERVDDYAANPIEAFAHRRGKKEETA